jgi:uncharacterized protein (DUF58 family)
MLSRVSASLTTRGRAFLSIGVGTTVFALAVGQDAILRVGVLLVALPLVAAVVTTRTRYLLSCYREVEPNRVPTDSVANVRIQLENPGRVPTGLLLLEDQVPYALGTRPRFVVDQLRPRWVRAITYPVRTTARGRYQIGPLTVRITDPFGFIHLSRSFTGRTTLTVTPQIHRLAETRLSGDWSGSGEQRPRAFAAAGTEDVTVREYRQGDDRRRIHWPSSAKTGELMVRREEQPHHSRATILLDNRIGAHQGTGPASSFEWAVSAAASIGAHLNAHGFTLRLVTAERATTQASWHDRGVSRAAELEFLLDELALLDTARTDDFGVSVDHTPAGLVIAVLGYSLPRNIAAMNAHLVGVARGLAIAMQVDRSEDEKQRVRGSLELLRAGGWTAVAAAPDDRIADVWSAVTSANRLGAGPAPSWVPDHARGPAA